MKKFSLIIPIYQNELNLHTTIPKVIDFFSKLNNYDKELICVNDGSSDNSFEILKEYQKKYPDIIKVINFTKNFGQVYAWEAGIKHATGNVLGIISADLQDPVELFSEMLTDWEDGYKVVIGVRKTREDGFIQSNISNLFHFLIHKYANPNHPRGGSDFFLFDRKVADLINLIDEKNSNTIMLITSLGFKTKKIFYERRKREAGKSQWTFWKKIKIFIDSFISNTYMPLRLVSSIGLISSLISLIYGLYIIFHYIIGTIAGEDLQRGWSSLAVLITFFSGLILISLGIIGEYLWRIYDESRKRPKYVIEEILDDTKN